MDSPDQLLPRLSSRIQVDVESECWLWTGTQTKPENGYGIISLNGSQVVAHRAVYEALVGAIPDGLTLDHLCRNRLCVNPRHMDPVTMRENILRGEGIAAKNARQTHCRRGNHPLSGSNLYITSAGSRRCLACKRDSYQRAKDRSRSKDA